MEKRKLLLTFFIRLVDHLPWIKYPQELRDPHFKCNYPLELHLFSAAVSMIGALPR